MPRYTFSHNMPHYTEQLFGGLAKGAHWHGVSGGKLPWPVLLRLGESEGRLVVTGLVIGAVDANEITSRDLRRIPIPDLLGRAIVNPLVRQHVALVFGATAEPYRLPRRRPGPGGYPREHYRRVAAAYRRALRTAPGRPVAELSNQLNASPATVRRWLGRARDMSYLNRAPAGRAGEQSQEGHE